MMVNLWGKKFDGKFMTSALVIISLVVNHVLQCMTLMIIYKIVFDNMTLYTNRKLRQHSTSMELKVWGAKKKLN